MGPSPPHLVRGPAQRGWGAHRHTHLTHPCPALSLPSPPLLPPFCSEISSFGLCLSWFLDKLQLTERLPLLNTAANLFFLITFTLTRCINLPLATLALLTEHTGDRDSIGPVGMLGLLGLCAMQFYWWVLIMDKACLRLRGSSSKAAKAAKAS